ncbi:BIR protein [Plasmodium berghei]|uniref:BIR protein n=2 Tax=Plasmodium berghei TaxID=5821 RepID=A0A509AMD8_PLABA|nr:BIR protein [Plasmodium berghei ANKA]CXI22295.1 BIR protein [Plasmodium berghei]SBW38095.1 BIR protein [Plasmodium berghei]SCL83280.1 BIR protein [Plasmodium berghei]SCL86733.1 BIR protein [Plasmodium berghei]VUC54927.1 BIR protein [Plasmodium berghei ANKA]|eukprot:XP_034420747.1 BIR protein [Plasmodium berghei ANKA]
MDDKICRTFFALRNSFSNNLEVNGDYQFIMNQSTLNGYCTNNKCSSNLEKINAGCLYLLNAFFKDSSVFSSVAKNNINIVEYIIMWLSYMLNLKKSEENISTLKYFYDIYIKNHEKYTNPINGVDAYYDSYKDIIDKKKDLINMNIKDISKFYDAFNTLCMIYIEFDEKSPNCNKYSRKANEFVEKYKKLNDDSNITGNSSYVQLLSTLLNDYNNFINKCSHVNCTNLPPIATIEEIQTSEQSSAQLSAHSSKETVKSSLQDSEQLSAQSSEQNVQKIAQNSELIFAQASEVIPSSSSIRNKLFTVLSIFGAIAFFLGISYKYSLFGFRKRAQKQYLREKIKNIKKRMNH